MSGKCFQELGRGSFRGDYLYERTVPETHLLRRLEELVGWGVFTRQLVRPHCSCAKRGRPPYDPAVILKMLLLSYLYGLSDRQTEAYVDDSLSAKHFLGLAVDEPASDHSTLTAFKRRIENRGREALLEELLREVILMAMQKGAASGSIHVVDSTHALADVNVAKEDRRRKQGQGPRDGGARWGVIGKRPRKKGGKRSGPDYPAGQKQRYKIERKFREAKVNHGLRRCRYVGRLRYAVQAYLTAIVVNLKRLVRLVTGVSFKGRARAIAQDPRRGVKTSPEGPRRVQEDQRPGSRERLEVLFLTFQPPLTSIRHRPGFRSPSFPHLPSICWLATNWHGIMSHQHAAVRQS
ncbi:MAG: transposase [Anaerolineae bacterium]|jgi:IS5 family transposase